MFLVFLSVPRKAHSQIAQKVIALNALDLFPEISIGILTIDEVTDVEVTTVVQVPAPGL